ncbi:hypothetical protein Sste5346_004536 [Sporothrix stenoceras]|uniref:Translation initiation factor IF-3 n=1 Tax=Sporothrix stenoceras TaxID=5173 RepID=A0ABR3Z8K4_9PEZI
MKTAAGLLTPTSVLARVFITNTGPRQTSLLASCSYASSYSITSTASTAATTTMTRPSDRSRHSLGPHQQRRCFGNNSRGGPPPHGRPGRGPPRRHNGPPRPPGAYNGPPRPPGGHSGPPRAHTGPHSRHSNPHFSRSGPASHGGGGNPQFGRSGPSGGGNPQFGGRGRPERQDRSQAPAEDEFEEELGGRGHLERQEHLQERWQAQARDRDMPIGRGKEEDFFGEDLTTEGNLNTRLGPKKRDKPNATPRVKFKMARMPRNREIEFSHVLVRHDDGTLELPEPLDSVLSRLDLRKNSLVVVALPGQQEKRKKGKEGEEDEENEEDEEGEVGEEGKNIAEGKEGQEAVSGPVPEPVIDPVAMAAAAAEAATKKVADDEKRALAVKAMQSFPVCRIINIKKEREAEAERKKAQRKKVVSFKELEMNWAIDDHNLGFRMKKLTEFLNKGCQVEIRLLRKSASKGKKQATPDEAETLVAKIKATVAETPGSEYYKPQDGKMLQMMRIYVKGPPPKN